MPTLTATATVSTTTEIQLEPKLARKLRTELRLYAELKTQLEAIEAAMSKHKSAIGLLREETGERSIKLDGFTVSLVASIRKKFDAKQFVAEGGDLAIYHKAMIDVPLHPYEKVTCPGDKNGKEDY